jgi:hypothetical protein
MVPRGFNNENPLARLVHSLDGGWESVAGGMLTLTVPTTKAVDFEVAAKLANLISADDLGQS